MKKGIKQLCMLILLLSLYVGCDNQNKNITTNNTSTNKILTDMQKLAEDKKSLLASQYSIPVLTGTSQKLKTEFVQDKVNHKIKYGSLALVIFNDPNYTVKLTNNSGEENFKITVVETDNIQTLFEMKNIPEGNNITLGGGVWNDENPERKVTVTAFKISETLVTQKLFEQIMGFNPSYFKDETPEGEIQELRPVDCVNWYTAVEFCNKLTKLIMGEEHCVYTIEVEKRLTASQTNIAFGMAEGIRKAKVTIDKSKKGFRLATKDEWEWAASAGETFKYAGSNTLSEVAWNFDNSNHMTHQVKKLKANKFGLYDMTGNLWEWCGDLEDDTTIADDTKTTVQKGACALCPISPIKDIYIFKSVQKNFYLNVSREKSGFRIACNLN